jgi:hypothetical protein
MCKKALQNVLFSLSKPVLYTVEVEPYQNMYIIDSTLWCGSVGSLGREINVD